MLALMAKNPITTVLGPMCIGLVVLVGIKNIQVYQLKAEVAEQKTTIQQLTDANLAFKEAVERQNEAVEKLKEDGVRRERAAAKAIAAARKEAESHEARAAAIQRVPVTGEECQVADNLITQYLSGTIH